MTRKKGMCYFCGEQGYMTDDHIPPRRIYPKNINNEYEPITVDMCPRCHHQSPDNQPSSDDVEYFVVLLKSLTEKTIHHDVVKEYKETIDRSLENPKKKSFWQKIARSIGEEKWRKNVNGIYVFRSRLKLDYKALGRVFNSMVRGFYFREQMYKVILNRDFETVLVIPDDEPEARRKVIYHYLGFLNTKEPTVKHATVFQYSNVYFENLRLFPHSIWYFRFFDAHDFYVVVYSDTYEGPRN